MSNFIDAHIIFSYKGDSYDLATTLNLDAIMSNSDKLPDVHQALAFQNNIDTYSYLYEVMETHEITYQNATGSAMAFLNDNQFDLEKFRSLWHEQRELEIIKTIAKKVLDIDDLDQQPGIKSALLEALRYGK